MHQPEIELIIESQCGCFRVVQRIPDSMERTCNYSPVLCACLRPNSNGEPRPRRRGGFVDIWGEVGNTGRGYIIDYICEFTARKFLNTRTSSVPRRSTSRWNPAARCRKTDAGIQTTSPPPLLLSFSNSFEFKLCRWFSGVERWYGWKFKQGIFLLKERVSP